MRQSQLYLLIIVFGTMLAILSACAPMAAPTSQPAIQTKAIEKEAPAPPASTESPAGAVSPNAPVSIPTSAPLATQAAPAISLPTQEQSKATSGLAPLPTASLLPTQAGLTSASPVPTAQAALPAEPAKAEMHIVQVEWPLQMRLGESDIARMALVPSSQGFDLVTEYPEHQIITQTVAIRQTGGYELFAVARLDGVGFEISPSGEQAQYLPAGEGLSWRWSLTPRQPGRQRLSITLMLRWVPVTGSGSPNREVIAFSRSLDVQVLSFFGLTQAQALLTGLITLFLGGSISLFAVVVRPRTPHPLTGFDMQPPNPSLGIELPTGLHLGNAETTLLKALFQRYARLVIQQEFLSGYSGARTFLALPIRQDGRADAYTITKIGERQAMQREYRNYETFVKDTLPPITARIQRPPVSTSTARSSHLAALQYTFIGEPGHPPNSLSQALLTHTDSGLLMKLLDTFGPNWWLQRRPYAFRMAVEYDRVLPTHLVLEPASGKGKDLDGRQSPASLDIQVGDRVTLHNFSQAELRQDGVSFSAQGPGSPGQPPLRIRWLGTQRPEGATGKIVATRRSLLSNFVEGCDLLGLPDPLPYIPALLSETTHGSQSIIHGDLNLENILVGPGGMLWLIDFAQTREGHTLFDFAHLEAEIIGHILAPKVDNPQDYLAILRGTCLPKYRECADLLQALNEIASRCLFNPSQPHEFHIALTLTCLGALKFNNLSPYAKHLLYLTAAEFVQNIK
jgi:Ternary complex associated domain 9